MNMYDKICNYIIIVFIGHKFIDLHVHVITCINEDALKYRTLATYWTAIEHGMNACLGQTTLISCRASKTDSLRKKIHVLLDQNTYMYMYVWCKMMESFQWQSQTAKLEQK